MYLTILTALYFSVSEGYNKAAENKERGFSMLGFDLRNKKEKAENVIVKPDDTKDASVIPTVVEVKFADGRQYPYYNDKFDLKVNDVVFVDGKLYGKPGRVVSVTDKFKISLEYYKKVLSVLKLSFHGSFRSVQSFMVCEGETTLTAEQVKSWFLPPAENTEEFIKGKGETVILDEDLPFDDAEFRKAEMIFDEDRCHFISVVNGTGTALIEGKRGFYTLDFTFENGVISDFFCDCIKPTACGHMAAVSIIMKYLYKESAVDMTKNFTLVSHKLFYSVISYNNDTVAI